MKYRTYEYLTVIPYIILVITSIMCVLTSMDTFANILANQIPLFGGLLGLSLFFLAQFAWFKAFEFIHPHISKVNRRIMKRYFPVDEEKLRKAEEAYKRSYDL